jgi:methionine synthase I (cobalamin-dependent)
VLPFRDALGSGRVLLMDGAMGTELQRVGLREGENAATWNVLHPDKVQAVHRAHLDARAEVHLTNTFVLNAASYARTLRRYLSPAAQAAANPESGWEAAFDRIPPAAPYRLASVGPIVGSVAQPEFAYLEELAVVDRCPSGHEGCRHFPDAILLETCSSPRVRFALGRLRGMRCPKLLSLAFTRDAAGKLVTFSGHTPEWFAARARGYGADALGVNCGRDIGMDEIIEIIRRYRKETDLPLFARPNAGTPVRKGKRWVYPLTPQAMAACLPELLAAGVCMVGGCCGTTPEHIAAFRKVVDRWNARRAR